MDLGTIGRKVQRNLYPSVNEFKVGTTVCEGCVEGKVASFPGLHAQLLSLAVRKAGEGLDGLIT